MVPKRDTRVDRNFCVVASLFCISFLFKKGGKGRGKGGKGGGSVVLVVHVHRIALPLVAVMYRDLNL